MEFKELIAEFGVRYGMEGLAVDEHGFAGIVVDGRQMALQQLAEDADRVIAMIELCDAPKAVAAATQLVLKANLSLFMMEDMALAIHPNTGRYQLIAKIDVQALDFPGFDARLARIFELADKWCGLLESYIPLAAQAGLDGESAPGASANPMPDGFMRV